MADSAVDPNTVARRLIQRAHNSDGLPEIAAGLTFLCVSGLEYLLMAPRESIASTIAAVVFAFLLLLLGLGAPWAMKSLRKRYLIGRWGYVQYKPIGRKQIGIGITVAILMAGAVFGVVTGLLPVGGWLLGGTGLVGGALVAWCGRLLRFVIGGVVVAAAGLFLAFSGVSGPTGFAILFGFQGLMALVSGTVVFVRFIRRPIGTRES